MKTVKIEKIENFVQFVTEMEVKTKYLLPSDSKYEWIFVTKETDLGLYSWIAKCNGKVIGYDGFAMPTGSHIKVKHWKTLNGTKRNLIKELNWAFKT